MKKSFFNSNRLIQLTIILGAFIMFSTSCKEDPPVEPESTTGKIHFDFDFTVDENPVQFDTLMYTNAAGNQYLIYEIQYFISNVTIYQGSKAKVLKGWEKEHYVDSEIPSTLSWDVYDEIEQGNYDSLSFTFGFIDADNQSFMFVNPPESNMVWPEYLGGGYHYMKINGKWKIATDTVRGFAFHVGRGQVYDANNNPISFIDNSYRVTLPSSSFSITKGKYTSMTIRMNVEEWFKDPIIYDHNTWGGDIMQNQAAMEIAVKNGWNVFELVK
jgi:hypothetical protein